MKSFSTEPLKDRWNGQDSRILSIIHAAKNGDDWTKYLVVHDENEYGPLPLIDDGNVPILENDLGPRDLRGIALNGVKLDNIKSLQNTHFEYSYLNEIDFTSTDLSRCTFDFSIICGKYPSSFVNTRLNYTSFKKSEIFNIDFTKATFFQVDFIDTKIDTVRFYSCEIRKTITSKRRCFNKGTRLSNIRYNETSDEVNYDPEFNQLLKKFQRIDRRKYDKRVFSLFYYFLTDYGQSFQRLFMTMTLTILFFGTLYANYPIFPFLASEYTVTKILLKLAPSTNMNEIDNYNFTDPYFYSLAVFTTIGNSEILLNNLSARIIYSIESLFGCLLIGIFIAMVYDNLANDN